MQPLTVQGNHRLCSTLLGRDATWNTRSTIKRLSMIIENKGIDILVLREENVSGGNRLLCRRGDVEFVVLLMPQEEEGG